MKSTWFAVWHQRDQLVFSLVHLIIVSGERYRKISLAYRSSSSSSSPVSRTKKMSVHNFKIRSTLGSSSNMMEWEIPLKNSRTNFPITRTTDAYSPMMLKRKKGKVQTVPWKRIIQIRESSSTWLSTVCQQSEHWFLFRILLLLCCRLKENKTSSNTKESWEHTQLKLNQFNNRSVMMVVLHLVCYSLEAVGKSQNFWLLNASDLSDLTSNSFY